MGFQFTIVAVILVLALGCSRTGNAKVGSEDRVEVVSRTRNMASAGPSTEPWRFLNTDLSVGYVEESHCAECHDDIAASFAQHPMGQSLGRVDTMRPVEGFTSEGMSEFSHGAITYRAAMADGQQVHAQVLQGANGETLTEESHPIAYLIGSGQRGRSYVIDHDGALFMSPLTWYPKQHVWDLSPGYETNSLGFSRPVLADCLFCHSHGANAQEGTKNRYREPVFRGHAIGCQRCHGPGELHVLRHGTKETSVDGDVVTEPARTKVIREQTIDNTIVQPARLPIEEREAICQQCHLAGVARVVRRGKELNDFRPGERLDSVIATYVLRPQRAADEPDHFVGQVEQMYASRCYVASNGALGCISCHDPHRKPSEEERVAFYRERCLSCHSQEACVASLATRREQRVVTGVGVDDCVSCHMPSMRTDVRHASVTDHRIPRNDEATPAQIVSPMGRGLLPIARFPVPAQGNGVDEPRDAAIALLQAMSYHPRRISSLHWEQLLLPLQRYVDVHPQDLEACEALGDVLLQLGNARDAVAVFRAVLKRDANREHAQVRIADLAMQMGEHDVAIARWEHVQRQNPWMPAYQRQLGEAYTRAGRWRDAARVAEEGVERFPIRADLWQLRLQASQRVGDRDAAKSALELLLQLDPTSREHLPQWAKELEE